MKLIECYIENFGRLSDYKLKFSDGLNTIKKDNGYGKTTLSVFIKAMLYGLEATKKQSLLENERKRYMPWQGGRCGGSLTFEANDKKYRVERTFAQKSSDDLFTIYDVRSGKETKDFSEMLGEELFGVDADGFERTVFLSENNLSGKNENKTISAKLSNLVGYDGDISSLGDALDALEAERKIYYKKGGSGEIGRLKAEAAETDLRINDIMRMKVEYAENEKSLAKTRAELNDANAKKRDLIKEAERQNAAKLKRSFARQYKDAKESIEKDEKALSELDEFFKNGVPTQAEVENARELLNEAKGLQGTEYTDDGAEFISLSSFFSSGATGEDFENARIAKDNLTSLMREREIAKRELVLKAPTEKDLPSIEEIDEMIAKASAKEANKVNKAWLFVAVAGLITAALGVMLMPLTIVGAIVFALGIILSFAQKSKSSSGADKKEIMAFIASYSGAYPSEDEVLKRLYELRAESQSYESARAQMGEMKRRIGELDDAIMLKERDACEFISKFPVSSKSSIDEAISEILRKRSIFVALLEAKNASAKKDEDRRRRAKECCEKAAEFLAKYPTVTERPLDEISERLSRRSAILYSLDKMKETLRDFAEKHGIKDEDIALLDTEFVINIDPASLDETISELERRKAVQERALDNLMLEISTLDELIAERDAKLQLANEYTAKLAVIQKTKAFLSDASDSLTAKYLSKTKAAFDKFIEKTSLEVGEDFSMNTSFEIMKNEKGALKECDAFSRGTRDLYALVARFSLIESLYENEKPFIILDDPFAYLDDTKLAKAKEVLSQLAKDKQIIYLTCTNSRAI